MLRTLDILRSLIENEQIPPDDLRVLESLAARLTSRPSDTFSDDEVPARAPSPSPSFSTEEPGRYLAPTDEPSLLGRGAMGSVVLVRDRVLAREVARKQLHATGSGGPATSVERFLREARVTARLEHPNIVPIYELGRTADGALYYTMRRIRGRSLKEAMDEAGDLPARLALLPHFVDLCQAVAFAHSRGVVHRDLKPANVMVGEFGETLLVDWGLAHLLGETDPGGQATAESSEDAGLTRAGAVMGTPPYMSPEQAQGAAGVPADLWSLGAVLFELLSGRPPYVGNDVHEILGLARVGTVPPIETLVADVSPELAAIVTRALQPRPENRYATASALAADVEAWRDGRRVDAYRYGARDVARLFARRYRVTLAVAAIAGVLVVGVGAVAFLRVRGERDRARASEIAVRDGLVQSHLKVAAEALFANDPIGALPSLARVLELAEGPVAAAEARIRLVATLDRVPTLTLLDGDTCDKAGCTLGFDDHRLAVASTRGKLRTFDLETGATAEAVLPSRAGDHWEAIGPVWSADGARLLVRVDNALASYSADLRLLDPHFAPAPVEGLTALPGRHAVAVLAGDTLRLLDDETGLPVAVFPGASKVNADASWFSGRSPDGVDLWSSQGERLRFPSVDPADVMLDVDAAVLRSGPETRTFVDLDGTHPTEQILVRSRPVSADVSGGYAAFSGLDRLTRVWRGRQPLSPSIRSTDMSMATKLGPGGRLATVAVNGLLRVWTLRSVVRDRLATMALSSDGSRAVVRRMDGTIDAVDRSGAVLRRLPSCPEGTPARRATLDAAGDRVLLSCLQSLAAVPIGPGEPGPWLKVERGRFPLWGMAGAVWVSSEGSHEVSLLVGDVVTEIDLGGEVVTNIAWWPDGSRFLVATQEGARVFDLGGDELAAIAGRVNDACAAGPDALIAAEDGSVARWILATGAREPVLPAGSAGAMATSGDGPWIAASSPNGSVALWANKASEATRPVASLGEIGEPVRRLAFSDDGDHVVAEGFYTGRMTVWRVDGLITAVVAVDADRPPIIRPDGTAHLWDLEPDARPVADWVALAELLSGRPVSDAPAAPLTPAELRTRWDHLTTAYPEQFRGH